MGYILKPILHILLSVNNTTNSWYGQRCYLMNRNWGTQFQGVVVIERLKLFFFFVLIVQWNSYQTSVPNCQFYGRLKVDWYWPQVCNVCVSRLYAHAKNPDQCDNIQGFWHVSTVVVNEELYFEVFERNLEICVKTNIA